MDNTAMEMQLFLDVCSEVEQECAEMYYFFAEHFADDRRVSRLWSKTAMEEENHARHVSLAKKMVESVSWINLESWRNASNARDTVRLIAEHVRRSPPSLPDALRLALQCEQRMDCLHMQNALLLKERGGNSMFRAMLKEDRGHVRMLEDTLDELQREGDADTDIIELSPHDEASA